MPMMPMMPLSETNQKQTRDFDTLKTQFKNVQKIPIGRSSYLSVEV